MIAHFVDCPENYGDLLYPVIFEKMLRKMGVTEEIRQFSFLEGEAPLEAGYYVHPIQSLFNGNSESPKILVIGGGALLRSSQNKDKSYRYLYRKRLPNPLFFDLKQWFFKRLGKKNYFNQFFRSKFMNYPAVGPYIIDPDDLPRKLALIYCSCGATNNFHKSSNVNKIKTAFNKAQFIYVRDERTRQHLLNFGVEKNVYAAPDLIVVLSDFFERESEMMKGQEILAHEGVNLSRRILVFQSYPMNKQVTAQILEQLRVYSQRQKAEIVLLPIGYCHKDHTYLQHLAKLSEGVFRYIPVDSIFEMISVIAAGDIFCGTSMHGNITAFSFGKPFLICPTNRSKQAGFLNIVNLESAMELKDWSQMNEKLDMVESFKTDYYASRLSQAKTKVYEIFANLVQSSIILG